LSVQLVGDFTQWQERPIKLQKGADGVWRATVKLEPGTHHYRFLVDGEWRDDPEYGQIPVGQKLLLCGEEEQPFLEVRKLTFDHAGERAESATA